MSHLKSQFPFFTHNPEVVYLDNAATTQKPAVVLDAMQDFYERDNVSIAGLYPASVAMSATVEAERAYLREFMGAFVGSHVIFTQSATDSLNILAAGLEKEVRGLDTIVVTDIEHHANILPWRRLAQLTGAKIESVPLTPDFGIDLDALLSFAKTAKIVALTHVSNITGLMLDIKVIGEKIRAINPECIIVVDGSQGVTKTKIECARWGIDAYVFSAHKIYGPLGIGVLWGTAKLLEMVEPYRVGGKMVDTVGQTGVSWAPLPAKLEAGTPNVAGVVGMGAGVRFQQQLFAEGSMQRELDLTRYCLELLSSIKLVHIIGTPGNMHGIISFVVEGVDSYDIGSFLGRHPFDLAAPSIAVRVGTHCGQPFMHAVGIDGTVRISFACYNTRKDVDAFFAVLSAAISFFTKS
jgi:SufS family cysteine desulfurase